MTHQKLGALLIICGIVAGIILIISVDLFDVSYPYWLLVVTLILFVTATIILSYGRQQEKERVRKELESQHLNRKD
jgi:F0F1-type ATP synthase assembly protein I